MTRSLRNLFTSLCGKGAVRNSARPAQKIRLQVEALEERAVPTANLVNCNIPIYKSEVLHVATENLSTGAFAGTFAGMAVTGKLTSLNNGWDSMTFQGSGPLKNYGGESVAFSGKIVEACFYVEGTLTQTYWTDDGAFHFHKWSTTTSIS